MHYDLKDLERWEALVSEQVAEFELDCYPQEFEICDHVQMLGMMTYHGMPAHYPHWSFGKSFEKTRTLYDYGVQGIPYEMVINSNPCIAGLMRDNSLALQILTMAHVYGHNDFFKNNITFAHTQAEHVVARFKAHADRIRSYVEDPSIGASGVERILDAAHALSFQCNRNQQIKRLGLQEQKERKIKSSLLTDEDLGRLHEQLVVEPDENILMFIRDNNSALLEWEKDILTIVHEEALYFQPQMETKIINEGWACFWHREILNSLDLPDEIYLEFLVRHNQVVRPIPGDLNPYNIGLTLWDRIEEKELGYARRHAEEPISPEVREKLFEIREVDRDASFIRRFMDRETLEKLDLFVAEPQDSDWIVTKIARDDEWKEIRGLLANSVGLGSIPRIFITDMNTSSTNTLYLEHEYDGRELEANYAEKTLEHLYSLWRHPVSLSTNLNGSEATYLISEDGAALQRGVMDDEFHIYHYGLDI
ncbi:stage V sporulation protein R [Sneathiella sp. P13V-1]|nr:stage V sporulation protein R [Sneathiella sp. P13V-1]